MPLDPQANAFLEIQKKLGLPDVKDIGIKARYGGHEEVDLAGPIGDEASILHRFITTPTADVPVRIYTPRTAGPFNAMAYFHGGGWMFGHIDRYDSQLVEISHKTNSIILAVNYQKSPEHKFPIPHDDCYSALLWLRENAFSLNIDQNKIGVGGDSAGGNLAAGVAIRARNENINLAYQLLIYPAVSLNFESNSYLTNATDYGLTKNSMIWFWENYIDPRHQDNPYAVPSIEIDFKNLAPAIISTAEFDVLRDDGILYANLLRNAGTKVMNIDFEGQIHGFFSHGKYTDSSYVLREWIVNQINTVFL